VVFKYTLADLCWWFSNHECYVYSSFCFNLILLLSLAWPGLRDGSI